MGKDAAVPPRRRFHVLRLALVLLAAIVIVAAAGVWRRNDAARAPAPQPTPAVPVQTATVARQRVDITRGGLGTVQAWNMAVITPQVSGRLMELPLREGKAARAGDVLVRIDPRPFQAALDQAKARKAQDQANLAAAEKNLARDQALLAKGSFATQQTVDNERAQVDADKAAIAADQAAIDSAQLNLDFATIKAPFDGVVSLRNVDQGNYVTPATNIGSIVQIEPIAIDFTLPQADLGVVQDGVARGEPQVLAFDQDGRSLLARGFLEVVNNQVDQASGTIRLKARFDNTDHKLWPGAFVQVRVVTKTEPDAIALPSQAVQRGPDGPYVWALAADQTAHVQAIQIEAIQDDRTVIADGLAAGDRIVVSGQYRLTQNARVTEAAAAQVAQTDGSRP
jgi:multidrug efflux system membrane fusion protein